MRACEGRLISSTPCELTHIDRIGLYDLIGVTGLFKCSVLIGGCQLKVLLTYLLTYFTANVYKTCRYLAHNILVNVVRKHS